MSGSSIRLLGWLMIVTLSGRAFAQQYQNGDYPLRPIQFFRGSIEHGRQRQRRTRRERHLFPCGEGRPEADIRLSAVEDNALFSIYLPGATTKKGDSGLDVEGATLAGADANTGASKWSCVLPKDGKYIITVTPTRRV